MNVDAPRLVVQIHGQHRNHRPEPQHPHKRGAHDAPDLGTHLPNLSLPPCYPEADIVIGLLYRAADALRRRSLRHDHGRLGEDLAHRYLRSRSDRGGAQLPYARRLG